MNITYFSSLHQISAFSHREKRLSAVKSLLASDVMIYILESNQLKWFRLFRIFMLVIIGSTNQSIDFDLANYNINYESREYIIYLLWRHSAIVTFCVLVSTSMLLGGKRWSVTTLLLTTVFFSVTCKICNHKRTFFYVLASMLLKCK